MLGFLIIYFILLFVVSVLIFFVDVIKWSIKKDKIVVVPSVSEERGDDDGDN